MDTFSHCIGLTATTYSRDKISPWASTPWRGTGQEGSLTKGQWKEETREGPCLREDLRARLLWRLPQKNKQTVVQEHEEKQRPCFTWEFGVHTEKYYKSIHLNQLTELGLRILLENLKGRLAVSIPGFLVSILSYKVCTKGATTFFL